MLACQDFPAVRPLALTSLVQQSLNACGLAWTLEDVCCFVPVWGGIVATVFTALLAYECAGRNEVAAGVAGLVMAIVPAHLQRSVGGGFDNESVAIPAMCAASTSSACSLVPPGYL